MGRTGKIAAIVAGVVIAIPVVGIVVLKSLDFNEYRGLIAERAKAATGRELAIKGDLKLAVSFTPSLAVDRVSFANAPWGSRPEMATLGRLAAEVDLWPLFSGTLKVNRLVMSDLDLLLETDAKGRGNWELEGLAKAGAKPAEKTAVADAGKKIAIPVVEKIRFDNVKVTYLDGRSGKRTLAVVKSLDVASRGLDDPIRFALEAAFNDAPVKVSGQLGSAGEFMAGAKPFPIALEAVALDARFGISGTVAKIQEGKGFKLALSAGAADLGKTVAAAAALAGAPVGQVLAPGKAFELAANMNDDGGRYNLTDLNLKLGSSDLSGKVSVSLAGVRPEVKADLAARAIDTKDLLAPAAPAKTPPPARADDGRVFPADPLPLDGLKAADAELAFQAKRVLHEGLAIEDVSVGLSLKGGRLQVKPLAAAVSGGRVAGEAALDASRAPASLSAKLEVRKLDYGRLLDHYGVKNMVSGVLDVTVEASGDGASVRAIMAGLNGKLRVVTENGKIESGALKIASADVLSALPFFKSEGDKDLRCGVVHFDVASGLATGRTILIETGGLSVVGRGTVNLADETLNLTVDPRAKKTSLLKLAAVPVKVGGTLARPSVVPDAAEAAAGLVKGVVGGATGVAGGVKGLIGGLVGQEATGKSVDETDYCVLALAGKPLTPAKGAAPAAAPLPAAGGQPQAPQQQPQNPVEDVVKGVGGAIKGLFGK